MREKIQKPNKNRIRIQNLLNDLKEEDLVSDEVELECLQLADTSWISALEYLLSLREISRNDLGNRYAMLLNSSYVDPQKSIIDPAYMVTLTEAYCRDRKCLPLFEFGDIVTTAMVNPYDGDAIDDIERKLSQRISPVFAFQSDIHQALTVQGLSNQSLNSLVSELEKSIPDISFQEGPLNDVDEAGDIPGTVELVQALLLWGRKEQASDIHLEPLERIVRVRFRIDGILQIKLRLNKKLLRPIINRLKVLSDADITESRRPQDGRLQTEIKGVQFEFRFSCVPTVYGEKVVLRSTMATESTHAMGIETLGLAKLNLTRLKDIVEHPSGVFFVTGPTGSGKTTTLFSILHDLNSSDVNVMTVEDPVERRIPGINQIQVNRSIDVDFASALRAFLRQDPDIILIGEIRDMETAKIAAEAALTGHFVLSTMHTNSALQAVTRLVDIGVEPFLVAPSIIGVMSQRLVRRLCQYCRIPYKPASEQLDSLFFNTEGVDVDFFQTVGCPLCHETGYAGRLAVHEILNISDPMRSLISRNASILEVEELAEAEDFKPMRYDALKRVIQGATSLEEIVRVVPR